MKSFFRAHPTNDLTKKLGKVWPFECDELEKHCRVSAKCYPTSTCSIHDDKRKVASLCFWLDSPWSEFCQKRPSNRVESRTFLKKSRVLGSKLVAFFEKIRCSSQPRGGHEEAGSRPRDRRPVPDGFGVRGARLPRQSDVSESGRDG